MPVNRRTRSRLVLTCVAGAVALAGVLVPVQVAVADPAPVSDAGSVAMMSGTPVPLEKAGEVVLWGEPGVHDDYSPPWEDMPPELAGEAVVQFVDANGAALALTAAGKVVGWGGNSDRLERVPAVVKNARVVQIAAGYSHALAVTEEGRVLPWGPKSAPGNSTAMDVPADLPPIKQVAMTSHNVVALTRAGQVVVWGEKDTDSVFGGKSLSVVPDELKTPEYAPIALSGTYAEMYALTKQHTVVGWGKGFTEYGFKLPVAVTQPGNVKAITTAGSGIAAVLADDSVITHANYGSGPRSLPASVAGTRPTLLSGGLLDGVGMVDSDNRIHYWNIPSVGVPVESEWAPAEPLDRPVVGLTVRGNVGVALVTKMLRGVRPVITGTTQVGSTLTGTAGTFSASPTSVASRWLVNGVEAGTGPTLTLVAGMVGKTVTYESKATKAGETDISSGSAPVTVRPAPIVKTTPGVTVKVTKAPTAKKAGTATITVKGGAVATGTVTVIVSGKVKKGKKPKKQTIKITGALKNGVATVKVKKIKNAKGKWTISAIYAGDAKHNPAASKPVKFKVKKK